MATIKIRILLEIKRFSVGVDHTFGIHMSIVQLGHLFEQDVKKILHVYTRMHTFKFSLIGLIFLYQAHPTITDTDG